MARPILLFDYRAVVLFLIGAIVMRGAGCTFNDIVDRNIDAKVARTRSRPIPSGRVKVWQAASWMVLLSLIGLLVLIQFNLFTLWTGIASLGLVAIYPFMKRITWWPQLFLGLAFSWGALVGWTGEMGTLALPAFLLYAGSILWVIGYDTFYALQDVEDDALIGVKSTARLFGDKAPQMIALFYAGAFVLWLLAGLAAGGGLIFIVTALPSAALLAWQVLTVDSSDPDNCLRRFKANHYVGLLLLAALWIEWWL